MIVFPKNEGQLLYSDHAFGALLMNERQLYDRFFALCIDK